MPGAQTLEDFRATTDPKDMDKIARCDQAHDELTRGLLASKKSKGLAADFGGGVATGQAERVALCKKQMATHVIASGSAERADAHVEALQAAVLRQQETMQDASLGPAACVRANGPTLMPREPTLPDPPSARAQAVPQRADPGRRHKPGLGDHQGTRGNVRAADCRH